MLLFINKKKITLIIIIIIRMKTVWTFLYNTPSISRLRVFIFVNAAHLCRIRLRWRFSIHRREFINNNNNNNIILVCMRVPLFIFSSQHIYCAQLLTAFCLLWAHNNIWYTQTYIYLYLRVITFCILLISFIFSLKTDPSCTWYLHMWYTYIRDWIL